MLVDISNTNSANNKTITITRDTTIATPDYSYFSYKKAWIRNIKIVLSNDTGDGFIIKSGNPELNIDIVGSKNLALNKDKGTVTITNLSYDFLIKLISGEYYNIEIYAGYGKDIEPQRYFKGEISYISQKIHSSHDTDTYINFASKYVAKFSQSRINLNLNSGINIYSAVKYICEISGINAEYVNISPSLKEKFLPYNINLYDQPGNLIDQVVQYSGNDFYLGTDSSSSDSFYIDCTTLEDKRRIIIDPKTVIISKGNPTISSAGLKASLLPTINLMPGDVIYFPNYLLDASIANAEAVTSTFSSNFYNPEGWYMIRQINYHFQNRSQTFELNITAVSTKILSSTIGLED